MYPVSTNQSGDILHFNGEDLYVRLFNWEYIFIINLFYISILGNLMKTKEHDFWLLLIDSKLGFYYSLS